VAPSAVVLNDPRKLIYQGPEGSSTRGKPVSLWRQVNVLGIYTESNHECILSDLTVVVHSADWLHLNTFLHAEDVLLRTGRFLNTWKTGFAIKAGQCSSHLYRSKPWIQSFWSNCSITQCWLTTPEHLSACGRCSTKDQKTPQHLEKWFYSDGNSIFWPCYWITP